MAAKKHLPSIVTALNLFAGFLSVIHSIQGDYTSAAWLIVVASIMDLLDGKVARLTKSSSEFGVELDSLADVSSFGFAPSILIYKSYFSQWDAFGTPWGSIGIALSFMPLVFGSIRLARFNVGVNDPNEKDTYFKGLPIPSSAIALAAFVVFEQEVFGSFKNIEILTGLTVLVSVLMVSTIRYEGVPQFSKRNFETIIKIVILAITLPIFLWSPSKSIFPVMMIFILSGILRAIILFFRSKNDNTKTVA